MKHHDIKTANPWEVLGLDEMAGAAEIRAAYLAKVKEFPPERHPEQFELIRDAYDLLKDPRRRAAQLLEIVPEQPLADLLRLAEKRRFAGPEAWLQVIKGK